MTSLISDEERSRSSSASPAPQDLFGDEDDNDNPSSARGGRMIIRSDDEDDDNGRSRESSPGREDDNQENLASPDRDLNTDEEEAEDARKKKQQDEERKKKEEAKKKKPKGPVRRQMISEDMLTGKNGIYKLPALFEDFKFGGKGQERNDLDRILARMEHWVHILHPKQPFDQSLQRIETLGLKKKVIKVHLRKIRMDMVNNYDEQEDARLLQDEDDLNNEELEATAPIEQETAGHEEVPDDDDEFSQLAARVQQPAEDEDYPTSPSQIAAPTTGSRVQDDFDYPEEEDMDLDMDVDLEADEQVDFIQEQIKRAEAAEKAAESAQ